MYFCTLQGGLCSGTFCWAAQEILTLLTAPEHCWGHSTDVAARWKTAPSNPFPKHERFWLAGLARALPTAWIHQPGNPFWSCSSLPPDWQCLGAFQGSQPFSEGSAHRTGGCSVLPANIIHYLSSKDNKICCCVNTDTFLNRDCISTGSLWINRFMEYRCYPKVTKH